MVNQYRIKPALQYWKKDCMNQKSESKAKLSKASYIVLSLFLIQLIFGVFIFIKFFIPDYSRRGVQEDLLNGQAVEAQAEVISILDTGRRYSKTPIIQFRLSLISDQKPAYQITVDQEVSWFQLNQIVPGKKVQIRYNPEKPDEAVILQ
jgi:Protein of unknown function (DUF3592)